MDTRVKEYLKNNLKIQANGTMIELWLEDEKISETEIFAIHHIPINSPQYNEPLYQPTNPNIPYTPPPVYSDPSGISLWDDNNKQYNDIPPSVVDSWANMTEIQWQE